MQPCSGTLNVGAEMTSARISGKEKLPKAPAILPVREMRLLHVGAHVQAQFMTHNQVK
jgi:hypothetical protein